MNYSPVKNIRIKNFMNIGDINIDFSESPIIALYGPNGAGKTAINKAIAVLGLHDEPNSQKDFIRYGTRGFGIAAELEDSTKVIRIKNESSNSYRIEYPDGKVWETNKIDDAKLPVNVEEVMGLVVEPETKEYLQVRTYKEQLMFVFTPGSANYKVMYNALKVENITKAIKDGSAEANELKRVVTGNESAIIRYRDILRRSRVADITPVVNIKNRIKGQMAQLDKLEKLKGLLDRNAELRSSIGVYALLENIRPEVSESEAYKLGSLYNAITSIDRLRRDNSLYMSIESAKEIEFSSEEKMLRLVDTLRHNESIKAEIGGLSELSSVGYIETDYVDKLCTLSKLLEKQDKLQKVVYADIESIHEVAETDTSNIAQLNEIMVRMQKNTELNEEYKAHKDEMDRLADLIKETGLMVTSCPNCGETVVFSEGLE